MNSNRYTPANIADGKIRFFIPLYQRLFAWSANDVDRLLKDLEHHFSGTEKDTPYYLGIITTGIDKTTGKKILVDGQQRLTVLMLFAVVFMKYSENWRAFFDGGERIELFARKEDSTYLRQLAEGITDGTYVNERMKQAYDAIKRFVDRLEDNARHAFIDSTFYQTMLFNSALPDSYLRNPESLNRYFEVMNSAGVSLEPHEVLKVKLLKEQPDQQLLLKIWNLCSDFSRPLIRKQENVSLEDYRESYRNLFYTLSKKEPVFRIVDRLKEIPANINAESEKSIPAIAEIPTEQHRFDNRFEFKEERSVLSFPEFLLLTLDIFKKQNGEWAFHRVDKLIERFTELLRPEEVPEFYEEMLKLRIVLDYFVIRRTVNGTDSDYSLLFADTDHGERLMQYEAMLHVSTPAYEWIKPLYEYVLSTSRPDAASLLVRLKKWDDKKHKNKVPDLQALRYATVDRYWFWRLDYYLWETYTDPERADSDREPLMEGAALDALKSYRFKTNRSIEHLHPQNQRKNDTWPDTNIDSFGNLAMISQSFNSRQSNDEVHVKFSRLETQIRNRALQSLKLLFMYLDAKRHPDEWTPESCAAHEHKMIAILNESFAPPCDS
ncbi:DUF262 domain-containing protein [uncultured Alistipes sp.]|uniref:DUF262 domain-containing protein n=1 Tax=uncultured Alistipes sp. TaxID=538949 RepID=UPI0032B27C91